MSIETVGPSHVDEQDKIKGGMVLAKLRPKSGSSAAGILNCR